MDILHKKKNERRENPEGKRLAEIDRMLKRRWIGRKS